jgi:histidinol-phosphate phosphatase family protein
MARPAIFLDRDGTLVHDEGYMSDPRRLRLKRNVVNGVKRFVAMGYVPVVVTNQSGVSRGLFTAAQLDRMHRRLTAMLKARGVRLAGIYACPHRDEDRCGCRKPKAGLLRRAARELGLDLRSSVMIGDTDRDVGAGRAVGATAILLGRGEADYAAMDLVDAAKWVATRRASGRSCPTTPPRP